MWLTKNKTPEQMVQDLVDIVSKWYLLLNVGPGQRWKYYRRTAICIAWHWRMAENNGEAIYGTRTWYALWRRAIVLPVRLPILTQLVLLGIFVYDSWKYIVCNKFRLDDGKILISSLDAEDEEYGNQECEFIGIERK